MCARHEILGKEIRMKVVSWTLALLLALALAPTCKKKTAPTAGADAGPVAEAPPVRPVAVHVEGVTNRCVGPLDRGGPAEEMMLAGKKWRRMGYELTVLSKDADDQAVLGLVSDIKDATEQTLRNLRHFIGEFKKRGADALIAAGDLAEEAPDIRNVVLTLAESELPTFVIIGNREGIRDYEAAVSAVAQTKKNLFDLNKIRYVGGDDFDLVSLPGYHNANHVRAKDGCAYTREDLADVPRIAARAVNPVVLVSHGPPRGTAKTSLDWTDTETNVGDPRLAWVIQTSGIPFGVFGNVMEAGGSGVSSDFNTPIPPGTWADRLYVNVGSASSFPWKLNNGEVSTGMAMVLRIKGKKGSFEVLRAKGAPAPTGVRK
jgi:Icc-related predicted phosphoesterase